MEMITAIASVVSALVLIVVLIKLFTLGGASQPAAAPAVDAQELAGALGGSIENAFRDFIPQPDKMSAAVSTIMAQAGQKATEGVTAAGRSLDDAASKLASALTSHAQHLEKADSAGREQLKALLTTHADSLQKSTAASNEQLKLLLTSHADSLQKATAALASQLDKITSLQKDIQQVLQIQQVTDGTMKQLASGVEFTQTLSALRQHLATSDSLIKEVTKPRTIRLVESES